MVIKSVYGWLILLAFMAPSPLLAQNTGTEKINWLTYEAAQAQGDSNARKHFIYFYSDRCGYCRLLEEKTFTNTNVIDYLNRHFLPVRINIDREVNVASQFGVRGVPDLRFLTPKGEGIARWPGFIKAQDLLPMLKFIQTESYLKMNYTEFLKQHKLSEG